MLKAWQADKVRVREPPSYGLFGGCRPLIYVVVAEYHSEGRPKQPEVFLTQITLKLHNTSLPRRHSIDTPNSGTGSDTSCLGV